MSSRRKAGQDSLTKRQSDILRFVRRQTRLRGFPPSVREIGAAVGLSSSSSVHAQLRGLEGRGYIRRDASKSRALEIVAGSGVVDGRRDLAGIREVPLVGNVPAGGPLLAEENIEDLIPLPDYWVPEEAFFLRVRGESMVGAGISDGDLVLVRAQKTAENGEIVVALVEGEATVKRFYKEARSVRLQPENPDYEPIFATDVRIAGKVVGLFRAMDASFGSGAVSRGPINGVH